MNGMNENKLTNYNTETPAAETSGALSASSVRPDHWNISQGECAVLGILQIHLKWTFRMIWNLDPDSYIAHKNISGTLKAN